MRLTNEQREAIRRVEPLLIRGKITKEQYKDYLRRTLYPETYAEVQRQAARVEHRRIAR